MQIFGRNFPESARKRDFFTRFSKKFGSTKISKVFKNLLLPRFLFDAYFNIYYLITVNGKEQTKDEFQNLKFL